MCTVNAQEVRPFWGRAVLYIIAAGGGAVVMLAVLVFISMRVIGYEVTPRQVIWPPAWQELKAVRARLFIGQAQADHAKGQMRDAVRALSVGYEFDPSNYAAGRTLARFYEALNPVVADDLYARLMREHPARRIETARVWFRSLLVRGRLKEVGELARQRILEDHEQAFVWTHALIFSAERRRVSLELNDITSDERYPVAVRQVVALAVQTQGVPPTEAVMRLTSLTPAPASAYEVIYRIERLTDLGYANQALTLLAAARQHLDDRDVARLMLAGYAVKGDSGHVAKEFEALLNPTRKVSSAEFSLLALHLVAHPDAALLKKLIVAMDRITDEIPEQKMEAYLTLYCAAGVSQDEPAMILIRGKINSVMSNPPSVVDALASFFLARSNARGKVEQVLPALTPMPLDFIYTLMRRYD